MIEIEINHLESGLKNREIKVWINGNLIYANSIATPGELRQWRDALHNELLWMNDYIDAHRLEREP